MGDRMLDILTKLEHYNQLDYDEMDYLYRRLNAIYGTPKREDGLYPKWPINLIDVIFGEDDNYQTDQESINQLTNNIDYVLTTLTDDEANVILLRFRDNMTLYDISRKGHYKSLMHVRQIEARALRKLRHPTRSKMIFAPKRLVDKMEAKKNQLEAINEDLKVKINEATAQVNRLNAALGNNAENTYLDLDIKNVIEFTNRIYFSLIRSGIKTVRDICNKSRSELLEVRNLGNKSIDEIVTVLDSYGLRLKEG